MKKYFVSKRVIEQVERMKDKLNFIANEYDYNSIIGKEFEFNEVTSQENWNRYIEVVELMGRIDYEGYSAKATWVDIEKLKELALQRDKLDSQL